LYHQVRGVKDESFDARRRKGSYYAFILEGICQEPGIGIGRRGLVSLKSWRWMKKSSLYHQSQRHKK
jgi:hypothetical protein